MIGGSLVPVLPSITHRASVAYRKVERNALASRIFIC